MIDPVEFGKAMGAIVREATAPLLARIDQLEKKLAAQPSLDDMAKAAAVLVPTPKNGEPGRDAEPVDVAVIKQLVAEEVSALPAPQNGKDGASVSLEDVAPMIGEHIAKAVAEIPAPKDGQSVPIESVEKMIEEAVAKRMQAIVLPKDGEPGRDGAQIEILPAISEEKTYPRGTYAKHQGGLWRSYETTSGMKGWECIVEGVSALRVEHEGLRSFKAVAELSSGAVDQKEISLPVMIYRGVFSPGEHMPGDMVTWAGSLWHCDEPTTDKPGEVGSKGWTLAVKRGRDGKAGTNGKDFDRGVKL